MQLSAILETAIYVEDLERAVEFYQRLFQLKTLDTTPTFRAFSVGGQSVLLLFVKGTTSTAHATSGGMIPPHNGNSPTHLAFAIPESDLHDWEQRLKANAIPIESRVTWPRGGTSVYFRDPDDNLLELATPGIWEIY